MINILMSAAFVISRRNVCKICDICYEKIKIGMLPLCNNCSDRDCLKCL